MRTRRPDEASMLFYVFDMLHQDGVDLRHLPLSERKHDLDRLGKGARLPVMKRVETFPDGQILLEHCETLVLKAWCRSASMPATAAARHGCGAR
jgi:ATP-dependent DNA ligase